jgi:NAD(P)-dependent dehydrogenase (short-subunit alcohol dehydrogenase family)
MSNDSSNSGAKIPAQIPAQIPAGSWALILGASSGFGLATAHKLAQHGVNLALVHRDRRGSMPRIEAEFERIRARGVTLRTWNVDALDPTCRSAILEDLADAPESAGRVRVLLHSIAFGNLKPAAPSRPELRNGLAPLAAAVDLQEKQLAEAIDLLFGEGVDALEGLASPPVFSSAMLDEEDLARTIHAMGTSLLSWTQDLLARQLFAADARVFGLTSEGNSVAWRGYGAVSAAKVALEAISRTIAVEFAPYGIRSNVIQAGVTDTPALRAIPGHARLRAQARLRNPLRRLTTPEDVANVIYLLSTDDASWINGALIRVDGGEHVAGSTG